MQRLEPHKSIMLIFGVTLIILLSQGSFFSIMQVIDDMKKAIKDSKSQYLLSEVGAGIKAILLISTNLLFLIYSAIPAFLR